MPMWHMLTVQSQPRVIQAGIMSFNIFKKSNNIFLKFKKTKLILDKQFLLIEIHKFIITKKIILKAKILFLWKKSKNSSQIHQQTHLYVKPKNSVAVNSTDREATLTTRISLWTTTINLLDCNSNNKKPLGISNWIHVFSKQVPTWRWLHV